MQAVVEEDQLLLERGQLPPDLARVVAPLVLDLLGALALYLRERAYRNHLLVVFAQGVARNNVSAPNRQRIATNPGRKAPCPSLDVLALLLSLSSDGMPVWLPCSGYVSSSCTCHALIFSNSCVLSRLCRRRLARTTSGCRPPRIGSGCAPPARRAHTRG